MLLRGLRTLEFWGITQSLTSYEFALGNRGKKASQRLLHQRVCNLVSYRHSETMWHAAGVQRQRLPSPLWELRKSARLHYWPALCGHWVLPEENAGWASWAGLFRVKSEAEGWEVDRSPVSIKEQVVHSGWNMGPWVMWDVTEQNNK